MMANDTGIECNDCGAEYVVSYDDDQFGLDEGEPSFCPFCGAEIDNFYISQELDFEEE